MATRATITVQKTNGKFYSIYSNWDGYINDGVGDTLLDCYTTQEDAESLVNFGDAACIGSTIESSEFYARDNGEKIRVSRVGDTVMDAIGDDGQEFDYVWSNSKWHLLNHDTNPKSLIELHKLSDKRKSA